MCEHWILLKNPRECINQMRTRRTLRGVRGVRGVRAC